VCQQVYTFFLRHRLFWDIEAPPLDLSPGWPALVLSGLILGAMGMLMSSDQQATRKFRPRE